MRILAPFASQIDWTCLSCNWWLEKLYHYDLQLSSKFLYKLGLYKVSQTAITISKLDLNACCLHYKAFNAKRKENVKTNSVTELLFATASPLLQNSLSLIKIKKLQFKNCPTI